jgi:hypothetical protein
MRIPGIVLLPSLIPAWGAEPSSPAPPTPEMERILQDLKRGGLKWTAEANQKFAKDRDAAVAQMNKLIDAYTRKGDYEKKTYATGAMDYRRSASSTRAAGSSAPRHPSPTRPPGWRSPCAASRAPC